MSSENLAFYSSWASIISFFISLFSLILVGSIETSIVKFRRNQRIQKLMADINSIPNDAVPLSVASKAKCAALKRNIPLKCYSRFHDRGRIIEAIHKYVDDENIASPKEGLNDWCSHSEEI